jgi:hypothetical protein
MAPFVYALCAATSMVCFGLLLREHRRKHSPIAFKSSIAFLSFALANVLLFVDLVVFPEIDLRLWRNAITLVGVVVLVCAVTQDQERRS